MKQILKVLFLFIPFAANSQSKDLKAEINQTAFDKIINSVSYPFKAFEQSNPFPGFYDGTYNSAIYDVNDEDDKNYSANEIKELFKWAVEDMTVSSMKSTNGEAEVFKSGLKNAWENFRKEILENIASNPDSKENGIGKEGNYTIEDLKKWNNLSSVEDLFNAINNSERKKSKLGFEAKAHLAYARVDILQAPRMTVNSPSFGTSGISVQPTAKGELWLKLPHIKCCRWIGPICVCFRVEWRWDRVASITVSPKIGADVNIDFLVEGLNIMAKGQFKKLFLDYPILREINFAGIVNKYLSNKKFQIYDVSKFIASIPYIESKFRISEIIIPPSTGSVVIQVGVTQTN